MMNKKNKKRYVYERKKKNYNNPAEIPGIRIGSFAGAPVILELSLLVIGLFYIYIANFEATLLGICLMTFLILVHELGHACVCRLVNVEVVKISVGFPVGYCYYYEEPYADPRDNILIAWGGVFAQFIVLIAALILFKLLTNSFLMPGYSRFEGMGFASITWLSLVGLNAGMIVTNLVPMHGLDGAIAWKMSPIKAARFMFFGFINK